MAVATAPLPERARELFVSDELPDEFDWLAWLTPRHMRLFAVELNAALANPVEEQLVALFESWEATAELDRFPAVQAEVERNRRRTPGSVDEWLTKHRTA